MTILNRIRQPRKLDKIASLFLCLTVIVGCDTEIATNSRTDAPTLALIERNTPEPTEPAPIVHIGDIEITSPADLRAVQEFEVVEGSVSVASPSLTELVWPNLTKIEGRFWIWGNTSLRSIAFNNLSSLDSSLLIRENDNLVTVQLPNLRSVGGSFAVVYNRSLSECVPQRLSESITTIETTIAIHNNKPDENCRD